MPTASASLSLCAFLFAVAGFALSNRAAAQDSAGPIVTVIHIDVMPPRAQDAATLLARFRQDSLHDPGEKSFQVLREIGRPNHFTLVEAWSDQKAYDGHNAAPHTRQFRDQLQPMLGSPFDERLHTELPAAP
ncbi:MAG: putative quinol monooxygenase [Verrucomicrobiota bacterium]